MTTCQYFGLRTAPFESQPDPRMYYASPGHAEALATMQYAVQAAKACLVVVGESGAGKTLLGQLIAQQVNARHAVLWVHGIGQPARQTTLTVCPPGTFLGPGAPRRTAVACTSLAKWLRAPQPPVAPSVLILDDADALPAHGWQDLLAIVTREAPTPRPLCVVLLGLPSLPGILGEPELVRLRRRVFRTCQIGRLSRVQTGQYIEHRMRVAGADLKVEHFTGTALDLIYRTSAGNPALINQICDNALVEAFADDTNVIDAPQIVATVHAITGGSAPQPPTSLAEPITRALPVPRVPIEYRGLAWLTGAATHGTPAVERRPPAAVQTSHAVPTALYVEEPHADTASHIGMAQRIVSAALASSEITFRPLDDRLRSLEDRLADALDRVRSARADRDLAALETTDATDAGSAQRQEAPADETREAAPAAVDDEPASGTENGEAASATEPADVSAAVDRMEMPTREGEPDCDARQETP